MHALRPALERRRPPEERAHDARADGEVVLDHVELGDRGRSLGLRKDHAVWARPPQFAPAGVDGRGLGLGHALEFYGLAPEEAASIRFRLSNALPQPSSCERTAASFHSPLWVKRTVVRPSTSSKSSSISWRVSSPSQIHVKARRGGGGGPPVWGPPPPPHFLFWG